MASPQTTTDRAPAAPPARPLLSAEDRRIVELVDRYLERGLDLQRWWRQAKKSDDFEERFELAFTFNRPDVSYGFFGRAPVGGSELPVLGNFQTQFYDQPKSPSDDKAAAARFLDRQLRRFVTRYFMRVSDFRDPQPYVRDDPQPPPVLRPLSLCTGAAVQRQGFGYKQLYYKRRDGGEVGKFPTSERTAIVDLRQIGTTYEWVVLKVDIFDFSFSFKPFGEHGPFLTLPLAESSLLILSRDFVTIEERPRDGELGHYGLGYAFIKNPGPSLLGWGPGEFDAAFQTIDFRVLEDGRIRVDMVFVANRPRRLINLPPDPVRLAARLAERASGGAATPLTSPLRRLSAGAPWNVFSFDPIFGFVTFANLATGGLAASQLCISRQQIEKGLLLTHFSQHYNTIVGSLQTWRQIRDWLDEAALPRWVVTGESA